MKCLFCLTAALCASSAFSSVTLFDFETEDERRQVPNIRTSDGTVIAVTNSMAPSGSWAIHATKRVWAEGMSDRAGVRFSLRPKMTDWRGYDRIVIDVFNDGPSGDWLYVRAVGPSDDWENGLRGRLALAAHCHMRWVVPLDWPKGFDASCVTRMLFNTSSCPAGFDLRLDGIRLLKPGETPPVPVGELFSNCLVPRYERRIADLEQQ